LGEEAGLKQWLTWCDEKIAKFGPGPGAIKKQEDAKKESEASKMDTTPTTAATVSQSIEAVPQQDPQTMPVPKISHDWYQTETQVVVEVRIKKLKADECKIEIGETSLSVTAPLPTGSEYSLELDLAHPVVPAQSGYKVLSTKIEIKLKKGEGVRWAALEGDGRPPLPGGFKNI